METVIFEIEYYNGKLFRVFCANSTQKNNIIKSYNINKDDIKNIQVITTGIHTTKQYLDIIKLKK